jgi:hypothetical protein
MVVDPGELGGRHEPTGDPGLVRHHARPDAGQAEQVEGGARPRHRPYLDRIVVVWHVLDEGSVTVEEDGADARHAR